MSKCAGLILHLIFQVLFSSIISCLNTSAVGTGFFVANVDMFDDFFDGAAIFQCVPEKCMDIKPKPETKRVTTQFKKTETFYSYVSTKVGLSANLEGEYTMSTTLSASSQSISGSSHQTSGTSMDIYALKETTIFTQDCQNTLPFSSAFLADLHNLPPIQLVDPNVPTNWLPYDSFLKKYGSHIVKEIHHGSRLQGFTFAEESKQYSETDFQIRGCVNLNYETAELKICGNYTNAQKQAALLLTMSNVILVKGGTYQTRSQLQNARTAVLIEKFLNEAETSPGNVLYKWVPIWDVLKGRSIGNSGDNLARALNLEQYYEGLLDFGCTFVSQNDVTLRWMQPVGQPTLPSYVCYIQSEGCKDDDSCNLGGAGSVCYCHGKKCVDSEPVTDPNSKIKTQRFMRTKEEGGHSDGINNSCYYKFIAHCNCHTNWGGSATKIWPTSLFSIEQC